MIENALCLSTAHLSPNTCNSYLKDEPYGISAYEKGEFGWFIHTNYIEDDHPEDLQHTLDFARGLGFSWVIFDRDADIINHLPAYAWD